MVVLIAKGLEAEIAGSLAVLRATSQYAFGSADQLLPSSEHLFKQSRSAGHRIVNEQVMAFVGLLHDQELEVVRPHVQQPGRTSAKCFANIDSFGLVGDRMKLDHVHIGLYRERQP